MSLETGQTKDYWARFENPKIQVNLVRLHGAVNDKTSSENLDSKAPSVGTLLAYLETTATETFSICLKKNFAKPHNISTQSDNETMYTKYWNKNCLNELNEMFHEILFQTDDESFRFLSWKTKKFYF